MNPLIIYQENLDGFVSAFCFYLALQREADYAPFQYGNKLPEVTGRQVAILDLFFPKESLEQLEKDAHSVLVIDHHSSSLTELNHLPFCILGSNKSCAKLTFDHMKYTLQSLASRNKNGITHPLVLRLETLVSHIDNLYQITPLKPSIEVCTGLRSYALNFETWREVVLEAPLEKLSETGRVLGRYEDLLTQRISSSIGVFKDFSCKKANVPPFWQDKVGRRLVEGQTIAILWYSNENGEFEYTLKSAATGPDVGDLARKLGGGGHSRSARFVSKLWLDEL